MLNYREVNCYESFRISPRGFTVATAFFFGQDTAFGLVRSDTLVV